MNRLSKFLFLAFLATSVSLVGCKKKTTDDPIVNPTDTGADEQAVSSDDSQVQSETNQIMGDIENMYAFGSAGQGAGKVSGFKFNMCGVASIDSAQSPLKSYTLTFDSSTTCVDNHRLRAGKIKITLDDTSKSAKWSNSLSMLTVEFMNYRSITVATGKAMTINGKYHITNMNGKLVYKLAAGDSAVRMVTTSDGNANDPGITITFDNGTSAVWHTGVYRTWYFDGTVRKLKVEGFGTYTVGGASFSNVAHWGKNRLGSEFATEIQKPVWANSTCGWHRPYSGTVVNHRLTRTITAVLGVDQSGNPVAAGTCPFGMKISWSSAILGKDGTAVVQY